LGTVDERMLILLDIEHLMTGADMALMDRSLQQRRFAPSLRRPDR
jgi:hypothetical protein